MAQSGDLRSLVDRGDARSAGLAYERFRGTMLGLADDLGRITPPSEVAQAHRTFVSGLREYVTGPLRASFAALARGDKKKAAASVEHPSPRLLEIAIRMKAARDRFRAKGYHLGPTGQVLP
jgi:hypothetical protein